MSLDLVEELEAVKAGRTEGKLVAEYLLEVLEDKQITISDKGKAVLVLKKAGGKEWLEALDAPTVLASVHGYQCSKEVSEYGQILTDQLRQQLDQE